MNVTAELVPPLWWWG